MGELVVVNTQHDKALTFFAFTLIVLPPGLTVALASSFDD